MRNGVPAEISAGLLGEGLRTGLDMTLYMRFAPPDARGEAGSGGLPPVTCLSAVSPAAGGSSAGVYWTASARGGEPDRAR